MKKLIILTLSLLLVLFLVACNDSGNTSNNHIAKPQAVNTLPDNSPQGDSGSADTGYDEHIFGQIQADLPKEPVNPSDLEDKESISVNISAANVYVLNVNTNSVLYEKKSNESIAPASTSKMLTALTVLEYCSDDELFTVGAEIDVIASNSSRAWLNQGDKLTVKQLLVALLLPSGNDAAYTLAVNAGKKIAGKNGIEMQYAINIFVDAMNQKAKEIGAASSNFSNPDGYDENGQYTTAFDIAQIAKACLDNNILAEIMSSYKISDTWNNGREVTYINTNELINPYSQYYYSSAVGLKTGSTEDAGSCLVSAAHINGETYICVVMGSSADIRFLDSLTVFNTIDPTISLPKTNIVPSAVPDTPSRR